MIGPVNRDNTSWDVFLIEATGDRYRGTLISTVVRPEYLIYFEQFAAVAPLSYPIEGFMLKFVEKKYDWPD
jgi:hypothetical protein